MTLICLTLIVQINVRTNKPWLCCHHFIYLCVVIRFGFANTNERRGYTYMLLPNMQSGEFQLFFEYVFLFSEDTSKINRTLMHNSPTAILVLPD